MPDMTAPVEEDDMTALLDEAMDHVDMMTAIDEAMDHVEMMSAIDDAMDFVQKHQASSYTTPVIASAGALLAIGAGFVIKNKFSAVGKKDVEESLLEWWENDLDPKSKFHKEKIKDKNKAKLNYLFIYYLDSEEGGVVNNFYFLNNF